MMDLQEYTLRHTIAGLRAEIRYREKQKAEAERAVRIDADRERKRKEYQENIRLKRIAAGRQMKSGKMASREDAQKWVEFLLEHGSKPEGSAAWHFGRCEIKSLLDYIYGDAK